MVEIELAAVHKALEDTGSPQGARRVLEESGYEVLHPPATGTPHDEIEPVERGATGMVPYQVLDPDRGRVIELTATINPSQGDAEVSTRTLLRDFEQVVHHDELEEYVDRYNDARIKKLTVGVEPVRTGVPGEDRSLMMYQVGVCPRYIDSSAPTTDEGRDAKEMQMGKIEDSGYDTVNLVPFVYTESFRADDIGGKGQRILEDMAYDRAEEIAGEMEEGFEVDGPDRGGASGRSPGGAPVPGRAASQRQ